MRDQEEVRCPGCKEIKFTYEFDKLPFRKYFNICKSCRNEQIVLTCKESNKLESYKLLTTMNSWPFYGSDKDWVQPPRVYYDQMLKFIGVLRASYRLVKMTNRLYLTLRELYAKYGLNGVPFPAVINTRGLAIWKDKLEQLSIIVLYSFRYYITNIEWQKRIDARVAHIKRRPQIQLIRIELRAIKKDALQTKGLTKEIKKAIVNAKMKSTVGTIIKNFKNLVEARQVALIMKKITPKMVKAIKAAKTKAEVERIVKLI